MEEITFKVQGSASEPYLVKFTYKSNGILSAHCTCPAGENGTYCKHRFSILEGSTKGIVSANGEEVKLIVNWLKGSNLETPLLNVLNLEKMAEKIKLELTSAKKELARTMRG